MASVSRKENQLEIPLVQKDTRTEEKEASVASHGTTAISKTESSEDEEKESDAIITPQQLVVILCNFTVGVCLFVALIGNSWLVTRNDSGITAGLRTICFAPHAIDDLRVRTRDGVFLNFSSISSAAQCTDWMHIHSRFDRVVSEFALSLLAQTRVYVIVAIVFVFMAVVLQVMGRIKKIKIAKTLERTGVLFASISSALIVHSLSTIGLFRETINEAVSAENIQSMGVDDELQKGISLRLQLVVYGYCLGLDMLAAAIAIIATAFSLA